jgi:trehalose/maltose hydrolase-like predicted phosphorylase
MTPRLTFSPKWPVSWPTLTFLSHYPSRLIQIKAASSKDNHHVKEEEQAFPLTSLWAVML